MIDASVVGLGAMGLPVGRRLSAAGLRVVGVEPAAGRRAQAREFTTVAAVAEAPASRVVIVFVATPAQLAAVVDDAAAGDLTGQTWVVMGTVGDGAIADAALRLADAGADVVDAPVTGGVAGAESGRLLIFASGAPAALAAAGPVLDHLGTVAVVGDRPGAGQVMKVVNQHLCAVHLVAAAEALGLARRLGLDLDQVLALLPSGAAGSWMLGDRGPLMAADGASQVRSAIDVFVKDADLVAESASAVSLPTPLLDAVRGVLRDATDAGWGARDDSRLIELYR